MSNGRKLKKRNEYLDDYVMCEDCFSHELVDRINRTTRKTGVLVTGIVVRDSMWFVAQIAGIPGVLGSGEIPDEAVTDLADVLTEHFESLGNYYDEQVR